MKHRPPATIVVAALASVALSATACTSPGGGDAHRAQRQVRRGPASTITEAGGYSVTVDPDDFVANIDNPYMPMEPGTRWVLRGRTDEGVEVDTIEVTHRTREVMGVTTTVVKDVVTLNGELAEKTFDWFAQDVDGNVWYFGERTAEYEDGKKISTQGAWEAGVDGALPGILLNADPAVTDSFRQEYYEGEAEDMFWVVATSGSKKVPLGSFDDVVRVLEWTPVEPAAVGEKYYARGIGLISERSLAGRPERFELVDMRRP